MTKKNLMKTGLAVAAAMVVVTGCGNNKTEETTAETVAMTTAYETKSAEELVDEAKIVLGNYKGLKHTVVKKDVTDEIVENELTYLASVYPVEVSGRPAKLGDVANIDYIGYDGDEAFEGGTASGYDLALGSGNFIDGFEDGIVGMEIGEERDLNLKFPEEYHSEALAGKEVVFHVKLNSLTNADESVVNDDLAKRVLLEPDATLAVLRERVREDLVLQAEYNYYVEAGAAILNQVVENSEITVDPDAVEQTYNEISSIYQTQAQMYGISYEEFLSYNGISDDLIRDYANEYIKQDMVLEELIKAENLIPTEDQKNQIAVLNGYESVSALLEKVGESEAERAFNIGAANFYLLENSVYDGEKSE